MSGNTWAWGSNSNGQLGMATVRQVTHTPQTVSSLAGVKATQCYCDGQVSAVLTGEYVIYVLVQHISANTDIVQ